MIRIGNMLQNYRRSSSTVLGVLDELEITGLQLGFADVKLLTDFDSYAYQVYRQSDAATEYFSFENDNSFNTSDVISWLAGSVGKIKKWGNQGNSDYPAYQDDPDLMPVCVSGGVWNTDGLLFDGTNDYMVVDDYSGIQITSQDLAFYALFNPVGYNGYIFCKNVNTSSAQQYGLKITGSPSMYSIMEGGIRHTGGISYANENTRAMINWSSDTCTIKSGELSNNGTYSGTLTNRANFTLGARHDTAGHTDYLNQYIRALLVFNTPQLSNYDILAGAI